MQRTRTFVSATLLVGLVALTACSSEAAKTTETSSISQPSSTLAADPTTTVAAVAGTTAAAATSAPTVTPTTTAVAGVLTPARNIPTGWVSGPQEGDVEVSAELGACEPFYDAMAAGPYSLSRCGVWLASDSQRMWTVTRGVSGFLIAIIWQQNAPSNWAPVLRALETEAGQWDDITIITGNTDSGPNDELVSGTRIAGASGKLALAVVDIRSGSPRVVAVHPTGNHGVALLRPGIGIEFWSAVEGEGIPKCCPLEFVQSFLVLVDNAWFVDTRGTVLADDPAIPPTEF